MITTFPLSLQFRRGRRFFPLIRLVSSPCLHVTPNDYQVYA